MLKFQMKIKVKVILIILFNCGLLFSKSVTISPELAKILPQYFELLNWMSSPQSQVQQKALLISQTENKIIQLVRKNNCDERHLRMDFVPGINIPLNILRALCKTEEFKFKNPNIKLDDFN